MKRRWICHISDSNYSKSSQRNPSVFLGQNYTREKNFIFSGVRTQGILKACLLIQTCGRGPNESLQSNQNPSFQPQSSRQNSRRRSRSRSRRRRNSGSSKKRLKFEGDENLADKQKTKPFTILRKKMGSNGNVIDLFNQDILDILSRPRFVKTRLYLMRGLNLTAQADVNSAMNKFAGYSAFSSANSFPQIVIGDGDNDHLNGDTKQAFSSRSKIRKTTSQTPSIRNFTVTTNWTLLFLSTGVSLCLSTIIDSCSGTR